MLSQRKWCNGATGYSISNRGQPERSIKCDGHESSCTFSEALISERVSLTKCK